MSIIRKNNILEFIKQELIAAGIANGDRLEALANEIYNDENVFFDSFYDKAGRYIPLEPTIFKESDFEALWNGEYVLKHHFQTEFLSIALGAAKANGERAVKYEQYLQLLIAEGVKVEGAKTQALLRIKAILAEQKKFGENHLKGEVEALIKAMELIEKNIELSPYSALSRLAAKQRKLKKCIDEYDYQIVGISDVQLVSMQITNFIKDCDKKNLDAEIAKEYYNCAKRNLDLKVEVAKLVEAQQVQEL